MSSNPFHHSDQSVFNGENERVAKAKSTEPDDGIIGKDAAASPGTTTLRLPHPTPLNRGRCSDPAPTTSLKTPMDTMIYSTQETPT